MDNLLPVSRAIATTNRNRNMVLAMFQRVTLENEQLFADGLSSFGVALIFGVHARVVSPSLAYPYEWLAGAGHNDNQIS